MHRPTEPVFRNDRPILEIDLNAIVANRRALMAMTSRAKVGAVLKANAYGLGVAPIAKRLAGDGCQTFFVATPDEALALRAILPDQRIFVLNGPSRGAEPELANARIIPVLNNPAQLASWRHLAVDWQRKLKAGIQIDTGMCRLGFDRSDLAQVDLEGINLSLVMSHLAVADEPLHPLNARQRRDFQERRKLLPPAPASLAASAGTLMGKDFHFDLLRPGIALYGVQPVPDHQIELLPVVRLLAPVLQVHHVEAEGTVGYGATQAVGAGMSVATLPIGYADGLLRAAGTGIDVKVAGKKVPVIGRISMDLITVDVSKLDRPVEAGATVEILAGAGALERVAAAAGTIPYELLVRLGSRIERRYIGASA